MTFLTISFAVLSIGDATDLAIVLGAGTVPSLAPMLGGGVAWDRWERRKLLVGTDLLTVVGQGSWLSS